LNSAALLGVPAVRVLALLRAAICVWSTQTSSPIRPGSEYHSPKYFFLFERNVFAAAIKPLFFFYSPKSVFALPPGFFLVPLPFIVCALSLRHNSRYSACLLGSVQDLFANFFNQFCSCPLSPLASDRWVWVRCRWPRVTCFFVVHTGLVVPLPLFFAGPLSLPSVGLFWCFRFFSRVGESLRRCQDFCVTS